MSETTPQPAKQAFADETDEALEPDFKPLTAEQARQWRESNPLLSLWRIVGWQVAAGALVAALAWMLSGRSEVAWSAGYGTLAVVVPAALMARGLSRQAGVAGAALAGFFVWELVKVVLTVAMLLAAPKLVPGLSWLALLAGFVVAMKVYWVAMWLHPARRKSIVKI
ncbi:MAG: ATP synthase subunit I [Burkholderiales bacterium]|nr:ATP synthase subunit I [Burkholderiales bacterium]